MPKSSISTVVRHSYVSALLERHLVSPRITSARAADVTDRRNIVNLTVREAANKKTLSHSRDYFSSPPTQPQVNSKSRNAM